MAGSCTRCNAGRAPTNDSGTPKPTPAISRAPIPAPAQTPIPAQAPAFIPVSTSVPGLPERYTNKNL